MKSKVIKSTTGKVYEVRKMRTEQSFYLPVYHARQIGYDGNVAPAGTPADAVGSWFSLSADTLAQAREKLEAA